MFLNFNRLSEQSWGQLQELVQHMSFFQSNDMIFPDSKHAYLLPTYQSDREMRVLMLPFVVPIYKILHNCIEFGILMVSKEDFSIFG